MSLRVAFVLSQFPALSETFVVNQVTGLLDRGVEVEVLSANLVEQRRMHHEVERYALIGRTRYAREVPDQGVRRRALVVRSVAAAAFRRVRSRDDVRWLLTDGRRDAGEALRFAHLGHLSRTRFDAILCHFGPQGTWGLALRNVGILSGRLVTVFHGYDMSRFLREEGESVYDRLFREGDLFLPVTDYWKRRLVELGCPDDRIVVHRMGVDLRDFHYLQREAPSAGPIRLLSVARLTEKKGIAYAIEAVAALTRRGVDVRYAVAGTGPDHDSLRSRIDELELGGVVELLGPRTRREVAELMSGAHVLVAPSVTGSDGNQEGLPVVLMEALASGLPVVSTRHTGIPELVEHGVTGMLADERDVAGLADRIHELVSDPDLYRAVAEAGHRRVAERHDIDRLNDRLIRILAGEIPPVEGGSAEVASVGEPQRPATGPQVSTR